MSVYFHSSFNLNRERLSGVLKYSLEQPELNDSEIAAQFGYRAPFTARYKAWLKKCGIIKNSRKVELTEYGEIIHQKDSTLTKHQTLWYMHYFLTHSEDNAEVWNYFYNTYLPKTKKFTKSELSESISMKLMPHNPSHFAKNAPMIKVITKVLIDSYMSETAFEPINIIGLKNGVYFSNQIKNPYNWSSAKDFKKIY